MASISFFFEEVEHSFKEPKKIKNWIKNIINREGYTLVSINYIFCSDTYLHEMNRKYLSHDTYTDILTFDQAEEEGTIEADIFISLDRVRENAEKLNILLEKELLRVMIHGVLHLMGYTDSSGESRKQMREKEDSCLSLYFD